MNYGLIGYSGRMGKEISELFSRNGHSLIYTKDADGENMQGIPELLIDFSLPEAINETLDTAKGFSCPLIIGTTGLAEENLRSVKSLANNIPIVYSRNFSTGIMIMNKIVKMINKMDLGWDAEIIEKHHRYKKDKPSGTALMIAENLNDNTNISSLRLGNIAGEHSVVFASDEEILEVKHTAISRETFARGVLRAANKIVALRPGFYSFENILGLEEVEKQWIATK